MTDEEQAAVERLKGFLACPWTEATVYETQDEDLEADIRIVLSALEKAEARVAEVWGNS